MLAASCFLLEHSSAVIKVLTDGSANLIVSPCEMGQGILGAVAQVATECTGLRYDQIRITTGDTDVTLFRHWVACQPLDAGDSQRRCRRGS